MDLICFLLKWRFSDLRGGRDLLNLCPGVLSVVMMMSDLVGSWPDLVLSKAATGGDLVRYLSTSHWDHHFRHRFLCFCLCDLFHIFDIISCQPTRQIINPCQLSSTPILSLIFSPTRQSPFINLGKLWSQNYFSFIMNDRFSRRYTTYLAQSLLRNPLDNIMNVLNISVFVRWI